MDKDTLVQYVEAGMSTRQIAGITGRSQSNTRRWLAKYGLKTKPATSGRKGVYQNVVCVLCKRKTWEGRRLCLSCGTRVRRCRTKRAAVELLGGRCNRCGWQGRLAGFEFHHKDKNNKDFGIGHVANKSWNVVKKEVMKCELLCSICHKIEHSGYEDEDFLKEVERYRGRLFDSK